MQVSFSGSDQTTSGKRKRIRDLKQEIHSGIERYLKDTGRKSLRLDEMFALFQPVLRHLAPEARKTICPFREILDEE